MSVLAEVFREPTLAGVARELATLAAPLWLAALVGLLIGWAWRPRWAAAVVDVAGNNHHEPVAAAAAPATVADHFAIVPRAKPASVAPVTEEEELAGSTPDLMHLRRVVEEKDGGPAWTHMMDRTLQTFRYQAWKREPQV